MRKTTPVSDGTGNPAYPCAMPLKSQADLQHKYANGTRQPLFFASFCNKFPVTERKPFGDWFCRTASTATQSMTAAAVSRSGETLVITMACQGQVRSASASSRVSVRWAGPKCPPVSGDKIPFPKPVDTAFEKASRARHAAVAKSQLSWRNGRRGLIRSEPAP